MPNKTRQITVDYIPMVQGSHELYIFTMSAKELWKRVKINEKEEDKDIGYQRTLSKSRVKAISKYVEEGNPIPLSILLSLDPVVTVDKKNKKLTLPDSQDAGWVIDGQHRLAGMHQSETEMNIGVIAFIGLDEEAQIKQFITINREGKGVPTSLYYDLLRKIPQKMTDSELAKERAADIAAIQKRDEESPFYSRIVVVTSPGRGQLSLTNYVRKIAPLVQPKKGKFEVYTEPEQRRIIDNFYIALSNVFPKQYKSANSVFFKTIGFGAMMNSLPTIFDYSLKIHKGFTINNVAEIFKEIDFFDFEAWNRFGTGNAAESQAGDDLKEEIRAAFDDGVNATSIRLI